MLAAQLPDTDEVRFRVVGIVRALEHDGRIGWVQPDRLLAADPSLRPQVVVRVSAGADPAEVTRRLVDIGAGVRRVGAAQTDNAAFLAVLAAVLRGVGFAVGLVCLYALVQALTVTARERRGAVAVLRASGADAPTVGLVLGGAAVAVAIPAAIAGVLLELFVLGPLVARLAAGFASLPLTPTAGQIALVVGRPARAGRGRHRRGRPARAARTDRRGIEGRMTRAPHAAGALLAAVAVLALAACGDNRSGAAMRPGSTLSATLVDRDGDGFLERGPGEPLRDRGDAAPLGATLATFAQLTDTHVRDEESPARVPFLDRVPGPYTSTFRPQEAFSTQVLDASVRAVNRERPQAVFVTGDITDNAQRNELDLALTTLRGGEVKPDSGGPGYDGVQAPDSPDPFYYRPDHDAPAHPGALARAQRPFRAAGLDAPWYALVGNHDVLAQGEVPPTPAINAFAVGDRLVPSLDPEIVDQLPSDETFADELVNAALDEQSGLETIRRPGRHDPPARRARGGREGARRSIRPSISGRACAPSPSTPSIARAPRRRA